MDQENRVLDVSVHHDGQTHTASYFVEHGIIHVKIGSGSYRIPAGPLPAEETVRSLLTEKTRRMGFRQALARKWFRGKMP